jgi:hypothetical protein
LLLVLLYKTKETLLVCCFFRVCAAPSRCVENYRSLTFANATKKCFYSPVFIHTRGYLSLVSLTILCVCVCYPSERGMTKRGFFFIVQSWVSSEANGRSVVGAERKKKS